MYTRDIKQWIFSLKEDELILAKSTYERYFTQMKEATFYQLLARLNEEKYLGKISKGLYYKPKKDDYSSLPSNDKLIAFFTNKNKNGMLVGRHMLAKYGIIDNPGNIYEIYTNLIEIKTRRFISNLQVENVEIDYKNMALTRTLEILELIEIVDKYSKEIKLDELYEYIKDFSLNVYNEDVLFKVLQARNYKKRNIASLKTILDYFNVENHLERQLNSASKYQFPKCIKNALLNR
jgi:hypothetical protein